MKVARFLLMALILLTALSSFLKNLMGMAGIPNLMPALRDPLLIALTFFGISRLDFYASRKWPLLIASLFVFAVPYLVVAMYEDSAFIGLYYLRIYLLPFLFFVAALGIFQSLDSLEFRRYLCRFLLYWNTVLFVSAVALYILLQTVPSMRTTLFGPDLLPTAWFISGGTWMRMGLPLAGPNSLGIVFALNAFVFISLLLTQKEALTEVGLSNTNVAFATLLALIGLMLTFSRSSMLLIFASVPLMLMIPGVMNFQKFLKTTFISMCGLAILIVTAVVVDESSNGFIARWITLNTSLQDPSMVGHLRSITDAIEKFHEYIILGYPKGSVGPKAAFFSGLTNNVESTFLAILYDMGIFIGAAFSIAWLTLLAAGFRHRLQAILVVGFMFPCLSLPYVFEPETLIYFSFIYLLVGFVCRHTAAVSRPSQQLGIATPHGNLVS